MNFHDSWMLRLRLHHSLVQPLSQLMKCADSSVNRRRRCPERVGPPLRGPADSPRCLWRARRFPNPILYFGRDIGDSRTRDPIVSVILSRNHMSVPAGVCRIAVNLKCSGAYPGIGASLLFRGVENGQQKEWLALLCPEYVSWMRAFTLPNSRPNSTPKSVKRKFMPSVALDRRMFDPESSFVGRRLTATLRVLFCAAAPPIAIGFSAFGHVSDRHLSGSVVSRILDSALKELALSRSQTGSDRGCFRPRPNHGGDRDPGGLQKSLGWHAKTPRLIFSVWAESPVRIS